MADKFRVALSGDFKQADGSPTFPDFDLKPLAEAPGVEMAFLESANPIRGEQLEDFDALILPGGVRNPDQLRTNKAAIALIRAFADAGKPVAAICHGPWLLIEADLLRGRTATGWASIRTDLRNAGANVVDEPAVTDGNIVTSRKPDDVPAFTEAVIRLVEQAPARGRAPSEAIV